MHDVVPTFDTEAELYSLLHRGSAGDVDYYLGRCRGAHSALELGVGYGRIALELAACGVQTTGLDNHPGLLGLAEQSARERGLARYFTAALGNMQGFEFGQRFERILIPYTTLYCLLSDREVEACLRCCRTHLTPGGSLSFDVYESDSFHIECDPKDLPETELEPIVEVSYEGEPLTVYERSSWDKPNQRLDVHYEYHDATGSVVHHATIPQRYLLRADMEAKLLAAGFQAIEIWGGFRNEALSADSDRIVIEARAPS